MVDGRLTSKGPDEPSRIVRVPLPSSQRISCFDRLALMILQPVDLKQSGDQTIFMCGEISPPNLLIRFGGLDEANVIHCG